MNDTTPSPTDAGETVVVTLEAPPDGDLSTELLLALESELNRSPEDLPPLGRAIDPTLVDALGTSREQPFLGRLCFRYAGRRVVVERVGDRGGDAPDVLVTIRPVDEPTMRA